MEWLGSLELEAVTKNCSFLEAEEQKNKELSTFMEKAYSIAITA